MGQLTDQLREMKDRIFSLVRYVRNLFGPTASFLVGENIIPLETQKTSN